VIGIGTRASVTASEETSMGRTCMRDAPLKSRSGNFPLNGSVFVTGLIEALVWRVLLRDAGKSSADAGDGEGEDGEDEGKRGGHRICV
jgi:hypothetical protein